MSNFAVKLFVGGPANGREEIVDNAYPRHFAKLKENPTVGYCFGDEGPPRITDTIEYEEIEYRLLPKRDGTWIAVEVPVWNEMQDLLRQQDAQARYLRQKVHDAVDRMIGW